MPNQLFIPFKKTTEVPIRQQAREHIRVNHTDTHPDAFKWDYNRWEALRKDATSCTVHVDNLKIVSRYDPGRAVSIIVSQSTKLPRTADLHTYEAAERRRPKSPVLAVETTEVMRVRSV